MTLYYTARHQTHTCNILPQLAFCRSQSVPSIRLSTMSLFIASGLSHCSASNCATAQHWLGSAAHHQLGLLLVVGHRTLLDDGLCWLVFADGLVSLTARTWKYELIVILRLTLFTFTVSVSWAVFCSSTLWTWPCSTILRSKVQQQQHFGEATKVNFIKYSNYRSKTGLWAKAQVNSCSVCIPRCSRACHVTFYLLWAEAQAKLATWAFFSLLWAFRTCSASQAYLFRPYLCQRNGRRSDHSKTRWLC